jgi:hypothetical protein
MPTTEPNYWVTTSIVDGSWVIVSDKDGGVIEGAETEAEAQARCAELNDA